MPVCECVSVRGQVNVRMCSCMRVVRARVRVRVSVRVHVRVCVRVIIHYFWMNKKGVTRHVILILIETYLRNRRISNELFSSSKTIINRTELREKVGTLFALTANNSDAAVASVMNVCLSRTKT